MGAGRVDSCFRENLEFGFAQIVSGTFVSPSLPMMNAEHICSSKQEPQNAASTKNWIRMVRVQKLRFEFEFESMIRSF